MEPADTASDGGTPGSSGGSDTRQGELQGEPESKQKTSRLDLAVLTAAAEGPWHRALAPRSGGNKGVSRLIGSALERTNVLGVPAHGEVSLIRGRGMDARVELFRAPLGPRCGCRILAYGRRGCESGRRVAAIEHHARVVRRCPASVHRVGHVVGHLESSLAI